MTHKIQRTPAASAAFRFVLTMGIVNLFADTTYEGGASINGPFLGSLGASAAAISIIAGAGEFLGYSLRSVSGYIADKTGKHWPVTFIGYATQDTLLKAVVAGMLPEGKRNLAFGLFYTGYGTGWLIGSTTTGLLYDRSIPAVIVFAVAAQLTS